MIMIILMILITIRLLLLLLLLMILITIMIQPMLITIIVRVTITYHHVTIILLLIMLIVRIVILTIVILMYNDIRLCAGPVGWLANVLPAGRRPRSCGWLAWPAPTQPAARSDLSTNDLDSDSAPTSLWQRKGPTPPRTARKRCRMAHDASDHVMCVRPMDDAV